MGTHTRWLLTCVSAVAALIGGCGDGDGGGFSAGLDTQLGYTPGEIEFAAVPVGEELTQTVEVWHGGTDGVLHLEDARLETDSGDLRLEGPGSAALEPGEKATWMVHYRPETRAPDAGTLTIRHNLPQRPPVTIPVGTPGQAGILAVQPKSLDFGILAPGDTAAETLALRNVGSETLIVESVALEGDAGDFAVEVSRGAIGVLGYGETREVEVTYTPTGRDRDQATLRIHATGRNGDVAVPVTGREMGPVIGAVPEVVGFGPVAVGDVAVRSLMLVNQGSGDLVVDDVALEEGAHPDLSLGGASDGPFPLTLGTNESAFVDVAWAPSEGAGDPGEDLGVVLVSSNDLTRQPLVVPVEGTPGAPVLKVVPGDVLDFGFVAQGVTATRQVTLTNAGQLPLTVESMEIVEQDTDEMAVTPEAAFGPTQVPPIAATLEPGASRSVAVTFTNDGAPMGKALGTLRVHSDDPERPAWILDLVGRRAGEATCAPSFSPAVTHFGGVPHQTSKTVDVMLRNDGTGQCTVANAWIDRCEPDGAAATCDDGASSPQFTLLGGPAGPATIGPGGAYPIPVRFDAPTFSGSEDGVDRYHARINAIVDDPQTGEQRQVPASQGGWEPGPNLLGDSGVPKINVYPDTIDFGFVPEGCFSETSLVSLYSVGPIPVEVTNVAWGACAGEFSLEEEPTLPLILESGLPAALGPRFLAEGVGEHACELFVHSSDPDDPVHPVMLRAEGVESHVITETFEGKAISLVDVLFVVDDSGSMHAEQANLADNFASFIEAAQEWGTDYRIGVTTTDMGANGALKGEPELVTPMNEGDFLDNVLVGTSGSGKEEGLAAAEASLTGDFHKYLREDASLVVIFVSDEDDQSPEPALTYLDFLVSLKGGNADMVTAYAIVGEPGGCSTQSGSATGGLRYIKVADKSGGAYASICDASFADTLATFGEGTFGPKTTFPLGGSARPASVEVSINGEPCEEGWKLADDGRGVEFEEDGSCLPDEGDSLDVTYELYCH
ncbi:MAG: choice-of-anchor D domain-containing protein [Myxococcota bacterium]